jgi:GT2 family glycosyltransferase
MRASIVVLNYNGLRWLPGCFDSLDAGTDRGRLHDVVMLDNGSDDGSVALMEERFPWVRVWRSTRNDFGHSYNPVVAALDTDAVILLNNDVEVDRGFVEPLVEHLYCDDVFAVVARILLCDRTTPQGSRASGGFHRGLWYYHQLPDVDRVTTTFFVPNQSAYSRRKYCELGGFDSNFWPLYHEDIELSYRAWRRGWRILYEPRSVIYHFGGQTRSAKGEAWHRQVVTQNTFLFQWKNIDDPAMRRDHLAWLGPRLARAAAQGDVPFLRGFHAALGRRGRAAAQRTADQPQRFVSDRQAFERIMAGIDGDIAAAVA